MQVVQDTHAADVHRLCVETAGQVLRAAAQVSVNNVIQLYGNIRAVLVFVQRVKQVSQATFV